MEHHSHIVHWQMVAELRGAEVKAIPITDRGEIDLPAYHQLLRDGGVKVIAVNHVSNALGTINPVKEMIAAAHEVDAVVSLDGAQGIPHLRVDVQDLDCDFYAFSPISSMALLVWVYSGASGKHLNGCRYIWVAAT